MKSQYLYFADRLRADGQRAQIGFDILLAFLLMKIPEKLATTILSNSKAKN